jgi:preprotein translocase subunit SecG
MGAAFGGANSATVFGAAGAATMLTKVTTIVAICFMATSIFLVRYYSSYAESSATVEVDPLTGSVMNSVATTAETAATTAETEAAPAAEAPQAEPVAQPQEASPSGASEGQ